MDIFRLELNKNQPNKQHKFFNPINEIVSQQQCQATATKNTQNLSLETQKI
jgi:hypothetical protein